MKQIYRKRLNEASQARRKELNRVQMKFFAPLQYEWEQQPDLFLSPGCAVVGELVVNCPQVESGQ
jgi:hypothetical protein